MISSIILALIFTFNTSEDTSVAAVAQNKKLKAVNAALRTALSSLTSFRSANQEHAIGDYFTGTGIENFSICGTSDYKAQIDGHFAYVCPYDHVMVGWLNSQKESRLTRAGDSPGYALCCPENSWEKKPDEQSPAEIGWAGRSYIQGTDVEDFDLCGMSNYEANIGGTYVYICPHDYIMVGWIPGSASWGKPVCCPKSSWEKYPDQEKAIGNYIQGKNEENFDECAISHYLASIDGEDANVCPHDRVTVGYLPDGGIGHTICCKKNSWEYKDRSAECLDTAGSATDSYGRSCASYTPKQCGDYDNGHFNANTVCCICGGGSIPKIS